MKFRPHRLRRVSTVRSEDGVTLVELMIVLVVFAILTAGSIYGLRGAKRASHINLAVATARPYDQAVRAFAADHAGRVPLPLQARTGPFDRVDWASGADARWGPTDPLARQSGQQDGPGRGSYVRSIPTSVTDGRIGIGGDGYCTGTAGPGNGTHGCIEYIPEPTTPSAPQIDTYELRVYWHRPGDGDKAYSCSFGSDVAPGDFTRCEG